MPDDVVLLDGADDGLLFGDGAGQGLFAVDVLFPRGGRGGKNGMPVVGYGDHDGVDIVAGHQLAIVVIGFAVGVAVFAVDCIDGGLKVVFVDVACGDDLAIWQLQKCLGVRGAHHAPADNAYSDAVRRGRTGLTPDPTGQNGGGAGSGTSGLYEGAPRKGRTECRITLQGIW